MPITFVGSNTQNSGGATSLTFSIPGSSQADDFMICFVKQSENTGQQTWDDDGGGGNGWVRLSYNRTTSGRDQETAVYWKIHSGSESNPTFTWSTTAGNEPMSGSLLVYRGTDTTTPIQDFGFIQAPNDANPPNASVNRTVTSSTIIVCHNATHDDISSPAAPTGYTSRTTIWSGTTNDHRNQFTADLIGLTGVGLYTPPDWQHTVLNNTPEYHCYTVALQEPVAIGITDIDGDEELLATQTNVILTGFGFGASQGAGKLEFWDDLLGTTKTAQSIDSWSETSIQFDVALGSIPNNSILYAVVTNNDGDESSPFTVTVGLTPYTSIVLNLSPDHYWKLNNVYTDTGVTGPQRDMTTDVSGSTSFVTTLIAEDTTHSWHINSVTARRGCADSVNMNISNALQQRTMGGWVQLNTIQKSFNCLYKEGGGVNNLAFVVGVGNVLLAALADTADDNVQAYSDFRLTVERPYHIMFRYDYLVATQEFRLFIDGRIQSVTDGNPLTSAGDHLDAHAGDINWGDPDNNLETGGTDINYAGPEDCYYSHWATWSENSANTGALPDADILELFRRGAPPDDTIATDTEANMQTAINVTIDSRRDWPLSYRINEPTGGGDLELTLTNKIFDSGITEHIEWRGGGTLTLVQSGTTNLDISKTFSSAGGSIVVAEDVSVNVTVVDINDNTPIQNARVYMTAASGGPLAVGGVVLSGITNASGQLSGTLRYSSDQPVGGRVRQGTSSTFYKTQPISATISSSGLNLTVFMSKDE